MRETLTIRIGDEERAKLKQMADSTGISASNLTRRLIKTATEQFNRDGFLKIEAQPAPKKP